jgi:hypothetical protein
MSKLSSRLVGAAALLSASLLALPAFAATCGSQTAVEGLQGGEFAGAGCTVDGLTFSNMNIRITTGGGGTVILGDFTPFSQIINGVLESGLTLNYTALAPVANATADIAWTYDVSGPPAIVDAYLALTGNTTGSGQAQVSETLSNTVVLSLPAPGTTTATFAPIISLFVSKDQIDFVGPTAGTSSTSILTNAFSAVPAPLAGAGLPGLFVACGGLIALARRRRNTAVA